MPGEVHLATIRRAVVWVGVETRRDGQGRPRVSREKRRRVPRRGGECQEEEARAKSPWSENAFRQALLFGGLLTQDQRGCRPISCRLAKNVEKQHEVLIDETL